MVLTPKNGNITIGNEVDLEYCHHNSSTMVQKWTFQAVCSESAEDQDHPIFWAWGLFQYAESGLFLNSRSNTSLTIDQGNFKS